MIADSPLPEVRRRRAPSRRCETKFAEATNERADVRLDQAGQCEGSEGRESNPESFRAALDCFAEACSSGLRVSRTRWLLHNVLRSTAPDNHADQNSAPGTGIFLDLRRARRGVTVFRCQQAALAGEYFNPATPHQPAACLIVEEVIPCRRRRCAHGLSRDVDRLILGGRYGRRKDRRGEIVGRVATTDSRTRCVELFGLDLVVVTGRPGEAECSRRQRRAKSPNAGEREGIEGDWVDSSPRKLGET